MPRAQSSLRRGIFIFRQKYFLTGILLAFFGLRPAGAEPAAGSAASVDPLLTLRAGHPRLLLTETGLAAGLEAAKTDPLRAKLHAAIITAAEGQLREPLVVHALIGPRMLEQSRRAIAHVLTSAMAFRLTGDRRFAERAKREMINVANFPDWNPSHFLDVAEMSCAVGLGYDWLYDQLSPVERHTIETALVEKSLGFAENAYHPGPKPDTRLSFPRQPHNWNQVCNGSLLIASLALADIRPEFARTIIPGALASLPFAMAAYQPDGAYPEGPGYWEYGTGYNVLAITALESALGTDFGLSKSQAFNLTAAYRMEVKGPTGLAFNYADGGPNLRASPPFTWLAHRFGPRTALETSRSELESFLRISAATIRGERFLALHALWFPAIPAGEKEENSAGPPAPLNPVFRGHAELAFLRSAWNDPNAWWVGFKAGSNAVNHSHLDLGSFVLEASGVRWAEDLGPDNYDLPGYFSVAYGVGKRWQYFRLTNLSHNTITPEEDLQDEKADAPILASGASENFSFAVADLRAVYPGKFSAWRRGVALRHREEVLVQDEITSLVPGQAFTWQMVTSARVEILAGGRDATLEMAGQQLHVVLLQPEQAVFRTHPATPPSSQENPNPGKTILAVTAEIGPIPLRCAVLFRSGQAVHEESTVAPLSDWK